MKQGKIGVSVCDNSVFIDDGGDHHHDMDGHVGTLVKRWKSEGEAETHAEIIRCAMAWEPSRAGRRWRQRTKPGRRAGDKATEDEMGTSREQIRNWLLEGKKKGATHVVVVCDTFDWEDFPEYVMPGEDPRAVGKGEMQKVMEVYSLALDIEAQLAEHRSFHY